LNFKGVNYKVLLSCNVL